VEEPTPHPYRTLRLLVEHGDRGAIAVTGAVLLLGLAGVLFTGTLWAIPVVLFADALLYVLARSYVELVRVIVDMLLPK